MVQSEQGNVIRSAKNVSVDDDLTIRLNDGVISATVTQVEETV